MLITFYYFRLTIAQLSQWYAASVAVQSILKVGTHTILSIIFIINNFETQLCLNVTRREREWLTTHWPRIARDDSSQNDNGTLNPSCLECACCSVRDAESAGGMSIFKGVNSFGEVWGQLVILTFRQVWGPISASCFPSLSEDTAV